MTCISCDGPSQRPMCPRCFGSTLPGHRRRAGNRRRRLWGAAEELLALVASRVNDNDWHERAAALVRRVELGEGVER